MGEAARRRKQGLGPRSKETPAPASREKPRAEVRLVATHSEVALASYLVDFAATLGIGRFRSLTAAIAYVTKVPVGKLIGRTVEVCRVPDGFSIAERLEDPRTTPPPLPDLATVEAMLAAIAPQPGAGLELVAVDPAGGG